MDIQKEKKIWGMLYAPLQRICISFSISIEKFSGIKLFQLLVVVCSSYAGWIMDDIHKKLKNLLYRYGRNLHGWFQWCLFLLGNLPENRASFCSSHVTQSRKYECTFDLFSLKVSWLTKTTSMVSPLNTSHISHDMRTDSISNNKKGTLIILQHSRIVWICTG